MNRHTLRLTTCSLAVLVSALIGGCGGDDADGGPKPAALGDVNEISFGFINTDAASDLRKGFGPFIDDMEKALGMPVKAHFASDYAGIIEGMRFGHVHIAWVGNKSAIEAADRAHAEVFAQTVALDGSPGYWSLIITHKDSPHQTLDDIIAHGGELTFGNGDPNSTSGYVLPSYYVWSKRGIDPRTHFKRVMTQNHETNLLTVASGQIDFATNNTENFGTFRDRFPDKAAMVRIVWKSPMIPLDPMVWRKDLPDDLKKKVRDFFFSYGVGDDAEAQRQRRVLAGMSSGWAPFKPSTDAQLIPIREIMIDGQIKQIEADAQMGAAEKAAKLEELRQKLTELEKQRQAAGEPDAG